MLTGTFCIWFHCSSQNCNVLTLLIQNLFYRHWFPFSVELHLLFPFSSATHLPKRGFIFKSKMDAAGYKRNCWNLRQKAWVLWWYFLWDYTNTLGPIGANRASATASTKLSLTSEFLKHNCGKQWFITEHFDWTFWGEKQGNLFNNCISDIPELMNAVISPQI